MNQTQTDRAYLFQSTLPVWGGTASQAASAQRAAVSIHPPRVGRDPRRPRWPWVPLSFQSTLPGWGGTGI